mmetsp:Transcript_6393/g.15413  ORF Transcript_6393/g.15413 Transcript_6393/m.15413 type:complete len:284 (+) Transcript_6393:49-900(+)
MAESDCGSSYRTESMRSYSSFLKLVPTPGLASLRRSYPHDFARDSCTSLWLASTSFTLASMSISSTSSAWFIFTCASSVSLIPSIVRCSFSIISATFSRCALTTCCSTSSDGLIARPDMATAITVEMVDDSFSRLSSSSRLLAPLARSFPRRSASASACAARSASAAGSSRMRCAVAASTLVPCSSSIILGVRSFDGSWSDLTACVRALSDSDGTTCGVSTSSLESMPSRELAALPHMYTLPSSQTAPEWLAPHATETTRILSRSSIFEGERRGSSPPTPSWP